MTIRRILLAITCTFLFTSASTGAKVPKWLKSVRNSVFEVIAYDSEGQEKGRSHGFFIDSDGTGISDRSVFVGADRAVTVDAAGIERPVNLILGANDMYDVVRFSVTPDKKLKSVTLSPVMSSKGNTVSVLPYSTDKKAGIVGACIGLTMDLQNDRYYYNLETAFDSSYVGCPVMDEDGMAIGIVQAGTQGDEMTYALDARFVKDIEINAISLGERAYTALNIRKSLPQDVDQALAYVFIRQSTASTAEYGRLLEDFLVQFPDNPDGLFNMGAYLITETDSTQYQRGLEFIEKSIGLTDEKDRFLSDYANLIYQTATQEQSVFESWTLDKALEITDQAIGIKEEPAYYQLQGNILYALKRYDEAFESYEKLNSSDLASADTYLSQYAIYSQMDGDPEKYISLLDSVLGKLGTPMPPRASALIIERASWKSQAGHHREAVADYNLYEKTVGSNTTTAQFHFTREQEEIKAKMYEQAIADINKARQLAPDDPVLTLENASLLLRIGNCKAALPLLSELEESYPSNPDVQRLLGVCCQRLGNNDKARIHLTRAKELGDTVAAGLLEE